MTRKERNTIYWSLVAKHENPILALGRYRKRREEALLLQSKLLDINE